MENVQNMGTISFTPLKSMAFNALFSQNFYVFKSIMWRALSNAIQISWENCENTQKFLDASK